MPQYLPRVNTLVWIERNTLHRYEVVLRESYLPVMQIETGPAVPNLLMHDTVTAPFHIQNSIRIPLTQLICARFESIYDTGRFNGEAALTDLTFKVRPYQFDDIPLTARIEPDMPAALPTYGRFPLRLVVPTPTVMTLAAGDLFLWSRANPNPPIYGLRAIAWAKDVQFQETPEATLPGRALQLGSKAEYEAAVRSVALER